jgi:hypothetical protein
MQKITLRRPLSASAERAEALFWDIQRWQAIWSPIEAVDVGYDDGLHQEFSMRVWRDGRCESVRTLRFRAGGGTIAFFSPRPPPMMSLHRGLWRFEPADGRCLASAVREYELLRPDGESAAAYARRRRAFARDFRARLGLIFDRFEEHFRRGR